MPHAPDVEHHIVPNVSRTRRIGGSGPGRPPTRRHRRAQLMAARAGRSRLGYRLGVDRLQLLHRAVYAVGHGRLSKEARWMAAVLAGGGGAALRRRSAAALWGFYAGGHGSRWRLRTQRRSRDGIVFHHSTPAPRRGDRARRNPRHHGPPHHLRPRDGSATARLERALNEAEVLRLCGMRSRSSISFIAIHGARAPAIRARSRPATRSERHPERARAEVPRVPRLGRAAVAADQRPGRRARGRLPVARAAARPRARRPRLPRHRAAFERDRERDRILQVAAGAR